MSRYYFAAFVPTRGGGFHITIPDVPNCFTCADTVDKGMVMAADVLSMMLRDLAENGKECPEPSSLPQVREMVARELRELESEADGEILYPLIQCPTLDMLPVKVSISIPKAILADIDAKAKELGYTRSGFLSHAAQMYSTE
jgi:predicted RNase H-like HicB family nuclease